MSLGKVLVVDDEPNERNALAELLRDDGYDVDTAANGASALAAMDVFEPHVVIADLQMPGIAGPELIARLRARLEPPLVIVMTEYGKATSAVDGLRAGAHDYLTKPIRFDELLIVLAKVMDHHHLEREVDRLRARDRTASAVTVATK
jgi:DNA-binding response OmpR family regulator